MADQTDVEKSDEALRLTHEAMWRLAVLCQPVMRRLLSVHEGKSWEGHAGVAERLAYDLLEVRKVLLSEKQAAVYDYFDPEWFGLAMSTIGAILCLAELHSCAYHPSERSRDVIDAAKLAASAAGRLMEVSEELRNSARATPQAVAA